MFKEIKDEIKDDFSDETILLAKKDITVFTLKVIALSLAAGFTIAFMPEIVEKLKTIKN